MRKRSAATSPTSVSVTGTSVTLLLLTVRYSSSLRSTRVSFMSLSRSVLSRSLAMSGSGLSSSARMRLYSTRLASSWFLMPCTNTLAPVRATSNLRSRPGSSRLLEMVSSV